MINDKKSFFYKNISPVYQALMIAGVILVLNLLALGFKSIGIVSIEPETPWLIFTSFILFFALINGILSISAPDPNKYWMHSFGSFAGLLIYGGVLAYLFSGLTMDEAGSYRFLIMLFTFCYILILAITNAMKKIVKIAQRQDK